MSTKLGSAIIAAIFWPLLFGLLFIGLWYLSIYLFELPEFQLPAPHTIIQAGIEERELLWAGLVQTSYASLLGFVSSVIGGVLLSLLLASSRWAYSGVYPYILILKMTPVIVLAPIIIIWFGQGLSSITIITFLICFFPIVANTTVGLKAADTQLVELFKVYSATRWQEMLLLRAPAAMPYFFTGLKIAAALTPIGALYGDTVAGMGSGAEAGLGFVVVILSAQFKVPALFAAAFTACAIGFAFVGLVNILSWWALHKWHDSYNQEV